MNRRISTMLLNSFVILSTLLALTFTSMGVTPALADGPVMDVRLKNSVSVANGDTTPSLLDFTDFGSVPFGVATDIYIYNTGDANLTLTPSYYQTVTITGPDAASFSLNYYSSTTTIPPGGSFPFRLNFNPSTGGVKRATINIENDSGVNPFTFAVQGSLSTKPGLYDLNGYMLGDIVVQPIFIDGPAYDWQQSYKDTIKAEIADALTDTGAGAETWTQWARDAGITDLNFTVLPDVTATIDSEPEDNWATVEGKDDTVWRSKAMIALGAVGSDALRKETSYLNQLRTANNADWAFIMYITMCGGTKCAPLNPYAYAGGPPMVLPGYKSDGAQLIGRNAIAHEMAHIFYANDLYPETECDGTTHGYLGIATTNCVTGSLMYAGTGTTPSTVTKEQIGWKDTDSDGLPDPIDTAPVLAIQPSAYSPNPTTNTQLTYSGAVQDQALAHASCTAPGGRCPNRDLDINTVKAQYRVDTGSWTDATSSDGAFDWDYDNFSFTTPTLENGSHTIEVRAINSVGNVSAAWSDTVQVNAPSTVTFNKDGGVGTTDPITGVAYNTTVTLPTPPTKVGHTFGGWFTALNGGGTEFTAATPVTANITIFAKWTAEDQTLTFDSNGGSAVTAITQAYGTSVSAPAAPTKDGFTFGGWYSDAGLTNVYAFPHTMGLSTTIYAKWIVPDVNHWAKSMSAANASSGSMGSENRIAVDGSGNVYTTGSFYGTVDFDPGASSLNLTASNSAYGDFFLSKLDVGGNFLWVKRWSNNAGTPLSTSKFFIDASGNVYLTGNFSGTVDFDPGAGTTSLTATGNDIYVLKLDADGGFLWAKSFSGSGDNMGTSVAVDGSGNVYTTGYFSDTVDFDPGAGAAELTSAGETDIFISKLDASGGYLWAKRIGGVGIGDAGRDIAVDGVGNVYTTGYFSSSYDPEYFMYPVDFDPGAGESFLQPVDGYDIFISKLATDGNYVWAKKLGDWDNDRGEAIEVDGSGNVHILGSFGVAVDFDPGAGFFYLSAVEGGQSVFISKLNPSGDFVWAKKLGGAGVGYDMTVDGSGNVLSTGYFSGTGDFDPGAGVFNLTAAGAGWDIFISNLDSGGDFAWAIRLGGATAGSHWGYGIDADSGHVYTTGYFSGTVDFDPGQGTNDLTTLSGDSFVSKINTAAHTVTFDGNGGTGSTAPQASSVLIAALPDSAFTHSTDYFINWNTAANGSGVTYAAGSPFYFMEDITLYAQWAPPPTLGTYPTDTSVVIGGNTTVTPNDAQDIFKLQASTSTSFEGTFIADPSTGAVKVINAHPAGTYTVTVTAFGYGGGSDSKTFPLTVTNGAVCAVGTARGFVSAADASHSGSIVRDMALGDFNGDGKQDLALGADAGVIRLGDGAGGFTGSTNFTADYIGKIAVGDFNNDGKQDIVGTDYDTDGAVNVYLGNGDGTFPATGIITLTGQEYPGSVAVGDFNNDGKQDVVVGHIAGSALYGKAVVLLGNGDGAFSISATVAVGGHPNSVVVGDFNNDGKQDFATGNWNGNTISVSIGNGDGTFSAATPFTVGANPQSITLGDFNSDGKQDVATANYSYDGTGGASIILGNGDGTFSAPTNYTTTETHTYDIAAGDFNNDGKQDLTVTNINAQNASILLGAGDGTFSAAENISVANYAAYTVIGDFNGDGKQDLAITPESGDITRPIWIRLGGCFATVTFDKDGGDGTTDPITGVAYNTTVTLPTPPTKAGYTFGGWFTALNGGGTQFTAATPVTASITVYAKWTADTYTVTFDKDGGLGTTDPITGVAYNTTVTLPTPPTKAGHTFDGWYTALNGAGTQFTSATPVTANITLYAKWTAAVPTYTVTFDKDGGLGTTAPITGVAYNATVTLPTPPTKAGYTFGGWFTALNGAGTQFTSATPVTANITLYAKWTANTYIVTFDKDGGLGTTDPITGVAYNTTVTLPTPPTKVGYAFGGWFTALNGAGTQFTAATPVTANITVYAKWTAIPTVQSITLAGINPIDGANVDFTVTFDKPVTGVDKADFSLTRTGSIMGAAVTKMVAVSQSVYTVTVYTGIGNGSLRLDLPATATIQDLSGAAFVGPYTGGEIYTISKGAAPTVPVLKLPKNKSLLTTSTPTLDWGDSSQVMALATGWHYEIQVTAPYGVYNETFNTAASADPAVGLGASTFIIPSDKPLPASTTFTWRVRAFDAAYRYSPWSKEFTFRTGTAVIPPTEGAPTVPTLKLPKNKSLVVGYSLILLDWNDSTLPVTAPAGCLYYEVRVTSPYQNYNAAFATAPGAPSEYTIPAENTLPADSIFTWQVRSACNDGATTKYSAWSKEFTFRTKLATPTLLSPLDDAVTPLDNIRPTFTWEPVPGAATYTLQVLNQDGKVVATGTVKAPFYTFTPKKDLLPNATYTWKVKANGKNPGDYSAPFTFVTGASAPAMPTPTTPKNNALVENAAEQTLVWSVVDNTTLAVSYEVEYATNAAFMESTILPAADKQLVLPGGTLLPGRTYYWRVRSWSGADATGLHSSWSKVLAIKVKFVAPTLTDPAEGTTVGVTPTFTWDSENGLWKNYTLQIATDAEFKSGLKSFTIKAPVTTFTLPAKSALVPGDYFWRVKINGIYTPITSEAQSFTVAP